MSPKTFLIIGTAFHSLTDYLTKNDHRYVVLKDQLLTKFSDKQFKHRVVCDFSSRETMLSAVDEATQHYTIDGVLVTYEHYVRFAAEIAAYLGLPGLPVEAVAACTDKFLMRQRFASASEPISPAFAVVTKQIDVETFAAAHTFPIMLKPANLSKSLLVFKNDSLPELIKNYQKLMTLIEAVYKRYAPGVPPKIIIEEFMEGPVHSVDAFVDKQGVPHILQQIVDYQTGYEIGYNDNFHYSRQLPSKLSDEERSAIIHIAEIGCRTLGMKSSPAHIEIIRTLDGPQIVEIGARNGGYRERMHILADGIDITGNALRLALGEMPDILTTKHDSAGVFELFPKEPGTFMGIAGERMLRSCSSFVELSLHAQTGDFVGKSSDGFKMCAMVLLHNSDPQKFSADVAYLNEQVYVLTSAVSAEVVLTD